MHTSRAVSLDPKLVCGLEYLLWGAAVFISVCAYRRIQGRFNSIAVLLLLSCALSWTWHVGLVGTPCYLGFRTWYFDRKLDSSMQIEVPKGVRGDWQELYFGAPSSSLVGISPGCRFWDIRMLPSDEQLTVTRGKFLHPWRGRPSPPESRENWVMADMGQITADSMTITYAVRNPSMGEIPVQRWYVSAFEDKWYWLSAQTLWCLNSYIGAFALVLCCWLIPLAIVHTRKAKAMVINDI